MDEDCAHVVCRQHHLIYREELKKDGEKKVLCSHPWCQKPIWGSLHNCVECGNRPVHRYSASSKNHCLEFTEKLENDGNKQVVCSGCDEPVLMGPAYKCPVSKCSFFIHKSCSELFPQKKNHPLHPDHTLTLRCLGKKYCDGCGTHHKSSFFYYCNSCDFQLDIKYAYDSLPINPNDCHQHEFFSIWRKMQFNCDACGEEITNLAYRVCNICKILVHTRCAKIPRTVKIKLHNHCLNLIYSLREINKRDDMICRICCNKVKGEYAAYSCQKCSYDVHTKCLIRFRDDYGEESLETGETIGHATHLIKALNQVEGEGPHPVDIQHSGRVRGVGLGPTPDKSTPYTSRQGSISNAPTPREQEMVVEMERLKNLYESQNVKFQEQSAKFQEQNVQFQEQNVKFQEQQKELAAVKRMVEMIMKGKQLSMGNNQEDDVFV